MKSINEIYRNSWLYRFGFIPTAICVLVSAYTMFWANLALVGITWQAFVMTLFWSLLVDILPILGLSVYVEMYISNTKNGIRQDATVLMKTLLFFIVSFSLLSLVFSLNGAKNQVEIVTEKVAEPKFDDFLKTQNLIIQTAAVPVQNQNNSQAIAELQKRKNKILDYNGNYEGWHKGNDLKKSAKRQIQEIDNQILRLQSLQEKEARKVENLAKEQTRKTESLLKSQDKMQNIVLEQYEKKVSDRETEVWTKTLFYYLFVFVLWFSGLLITAINAQAKATALLETERTEKETDLTSYFLKVAKKLHTENPEMKKIDIYRKTCEYFKSENLRPISQATFYQMFA